MPYNDILAKLKAAIRHVSDHIQDYVTKPGSDFTQDGKLPPEILMAFLIGQGSKSTHNELIEAFNANSDRPSASALVQKRAKLLPSALSEVFYRFNKSLEVTSSDGDYRLFAVDGATLTFLSDSRFSTDEYFTTQGNSAKGCYSVHLTTSFGLDSNRYTDAVIQAITKKDEFDAFRIMVDRYSLSPEAHAVFIADRGFCSYNNMAHVIQKGQFFLFRAKDIHSKGLLHHIEFPSDGAFDCSVQLVIVRRNSKKRSLPDGYVRFVAKETSFDFVEYGSDDFYLLPLRVVRFKLPSGEFESLVTNLPQDAFSAKMLEALYARRWGIETSFRTLKYTIGLSKFHARKATSILQEIWARLICFNFTSAVMDCVVIPVRKNKYPYKVSVSAAVLASRLLILTLITRSTFDLIALLQRELVPIRTGRSFPRLTTAHFRRPAYFLYRPS